MPRISSSTIRRQPKRIGNSVFLGTHYGKELGYSMHAKQVIRENPGLLKAMHEVSKIKKAYYEDPKGRFQILNQKPKAGRNTNESYIFKTKDKKYFIKEINDTSKDRDYSFDIKHKHGRDGVSEHIALELLKEQGVDVIHAHFSYVDPISKKSFIAYEFSQLKTLDELYRSGEITAIKYKNIKQQIKYIEKEINSKFHSYGLNKYKQIWDIDTDNVFYSLGRNKFYVFDPILLKK